MGYIFKVIPETRILRVTFCQPQNTDLADYKCFSFLLFDYLSKESNHLNLKSSVVFRLSVHNLIY